MEALDAIADMIARGEAAQGKFAVGTAQHTLQRNRLHALRVAGAAIAGEAVAAADVEAARAPIASLLSKSEKSREKVAEGSWQRRMLDRNIAALRLAQELLATQN